MPMIFNPQAIQRLKAYGTRHFLDVGGGDAPGPDPLIGQSAMANVQLGNRALDMYERIYNSDIRPRQQQLDNLTSQVTQQQLSDMRSSSRFAEEQRNQYRGLYMPLEQRVVDDANNYDSAGNVDRRMGIASANVASAFSKAREESIRSLQKYGLNPNSGAFAATNARLAGAQGLADAGARTGAAFDTMDRGIALRAGAAQTGRGLANGAAQALATGNAAGSSAVGGANQTAGTGINGAGVMGQGFGAAMQGNTSAGNMMLGQYQGQLNAYGQKQEMTGSLLGAGITGAFMLSSEKVKDRKEPVDDHAVLERIRGLRNDQWSYKGDTQRHIHPYAEEMHAKFGVGDGTTVGAGDAAGIALSGVKALADDIDQIKGALGIRTPGKSNKQRGLRVQ